MHTKQKMSQNFYDTRYYPIHIYTYWNSTYVMVDAFLFAFYPTHIRFFTPFLPYHLLPINLLALWVITSVIQLTFTQLVVSRCTIPPSPSTPPPNRDYLASEFYITAVKPRNLLPMELHFLSSFWYLSSNWPDFYASSHTHTSHHQLPIHPLLAMLDSDVLT